MLSGAFTIGAEQTSVNISVFQEREEKEAAERSKLEAARKEKEAAKKILKKERKALRTICKDANFFSDSEDERVGPLTEPAIE